MRISHHSECSRRKRQRAKDQTIKLRATLFATPLLINKNSRQAFKGGSLKTASSERMVTLIYRIPMDVMANHSSSSTDSAGHADSRAPWMGKLLILATHFVIINGTLIPFLTLLIFPLTGSHHRAATDYRRKVLHTRGVDITASWSSMADSHDDCWCHKVVKLSSIQTTDLFQSRNSRAWLFLLILLTMCGRKSGCFPNINWEPSTPAPQTVSVPVHRTVTITLEVHRASQDQWNYPI